ncbi:hypothetical protein RQ832_05250, partial [Roseomonas sp. DSM 102946]|nr:hypothetical protein [Roseomonas sp. DSM 102946]
MARPDTSAAKLVEITTLVEKDIPFFERIARKLILLDRDKFDFLKVQIAILDVRHPQIRDRKRVFEFPFFALGYPCS